LFDDSIHPAQKAGFVFLTTSNKKSAAPFMELKTSLHHILQKAKILTKLA